MKQSNNMKSKIRKRLKSCHEKVSLILDNLTLTTAALVIISVYLIRQSMKSKSSKGKFKNS